MYVGHAGAALGGKRLAPAVTLSSLIIATYIPDWVDAGLCATGRYHDAQMLSHSLPAVLLLAVAAAATQLRDFRAASVMAAVVVSHVLLDYVTGIKPTWPGGPVIGLQLYAHPLVDFLVESAVILAGWIFYRRTFPPNARGRPSPSAMLIVLVLMQGAVDALRLLFPVISKC